MTDPAEIKDRFSTSEHGNTLLCKERREIVQTRNKRSMMQSEATDDPI